MYSTPSHTLSQWKDVSGFVVDHSQFTAPQIRYLLRQRRINGLMELDAVRKIGRKLYIHENRFSEWMESMGES